MATVLSLIIAYTAPNIVDSDAEAELAAEQPKSSSGGNPVVVELSSSEDEQSSSDSDSGSNSEDDVVESDNNSEVEITATKLQQRLALEVSIRVSHISFFSSHKFLKRPVIRRREIPEDKREEGLPDTSHTAETSRSASRSEGNSRNLKTGHKVSKPIFHSRVKLTTMLMFLLM